MIVKQIKYYDEDNARLLNNPVDITAEKLVKGDYFSDIECNEIQIKAYPGTILYINGEEVHIGEVGVYDILYRENMIISSIKVNEDSINYIKDHDYAYFIITFIQDSEDEDSNSNSNSDDSGANSDNPSDADDSSIDNDSRDRIYNHDKW